MEVLDGMIGNFIYVEAQESCKLLTGANDTRRRYIKKNNPNPIKSEYAQYAHANHDSFRYIEWLQHRMFDSDSFEKIEEWLTENGIEFNDCCAACDTLLTDILFSIAYPNISNGVEVKLPEKNGNKGTSNSLFSEADKDLLKEFHIDFDSILEKCIASDQAEVWFTGNLMATINALYYEKWKNEVSRFDDIGLQSDILSTIATLQDFCSALDPDSELAPGVSVRKLRIKLRDNYVKLHPDNYAALYPYDAFIDDWDDDVDV